MNDLSTSNNIQHKQIDISYDLERSYTAYSGSVIIGCALPDEVEYLHIYPLH